MLEHEEIWVAIDTLARENGLSVSGLARLAGLDPTTFNRSKRVGRYGKLRWPTTESIAKILIATDTTVREFVELLPGKDGSGAAWYLPCVTSPDNIPDESTLDAMALRDFEKAPIALSGRGGNFLIKVDADLEAPPFRSGDRLICSSVEPIRVGSPLLLQQHDTRLSLHMLEDETSDSLTFAGRTPDIPPETLFKTDVWRVWRVVGVLY